MAELATRRPERPAIRSDSTHLAGGRRHNEPCHIPQSEWT